MTKKPKLNWRKHLRGNEAGELAALADQLSRTISQFQGNGKKIRAARDLIIDRALKRARRAKRAAKKKAEKG